MPTIQTFAGFEWGTIHDVAAGNAGTKIFDGVTGVYGTNLDVVSGSGSAIGSYVGQVAVIANKNMYWDTNTIGTGKTDLVVSLKFRFTSFPTSDNDFHSIDTAASTDRAGFYYEVATGKVHAWITTATQTASFALVLNTWYTLQFKYSVSASLETLDWVLNGVTQTQVTNNLGTSTIARYALGNRGGSNGTVQFDDVALSTTAADHPLPNYNVRLVKADTGGTTTEIGTANSTARFTANGTLDTTHNSANILAAVSEVPPTIGSTASGVAQRAGTTTDAVSIPMTTFTLGGDTIVASRVYVCGWANGTLANNIGVRAWNGSAETVLVAGTVASSFTNNTTDPDWFAAMYAGVTNQTTLDALEIRLGYSSDISPEPGAHAVYAEILTLPGTGSTVTPNGITSNEQFGSPSVTPGSITLSQSGVVSGERFGSPAITSAVTVSQSGVVSGEQFGSPAVSATASVQPSGVTSSERFGSPSILNVNTVSPSGITTGQIVGSPTVMSVVSVNGNGVTTSEQFGSPAVTPGPVTVSPSGIVTVEKFGTHSVTPGVVTVNGNGVTTAERFGSATVFSSVGVAPGGASSSEQFGSPSIIAGPATVVPGGSCSSEQFGSASVSTGVATIAPGGSGTTERFGSPTATPGTVSASPGGAATSEQFGSPTISSSSGSITAAGVITSERFGSSSVTPGAVVLQMAGVGTTERFGSPSVAIVANQTCHPGGMVSAESFGTPHISFAIAVQYGDVVECAIDRSIVVCSLDRRVVTTYIDREEVSVDMNGAL